MQPCIGAEVCRCVCVCVGSWTNQNPQKRLAQRTACEHVYTCLIRLIKHGWGQVLKCWKSQDWVLLHVDSHDNFGWRQDTNCSFHFAGGPQYLPNCWWASPPPKRNQIHQWSDHHHIYTFPHMFVETTRLGNVGHLEKNIMGEHRYLPELGLPGSKRKLSRVQSCAGSAGMLTLWENSKWNK